MRRSRGLRELTGFRVSFNGFHGVSEAFQGVLGQIGVFLKSSCGFYGT